MTRDQFAEVACCAAWCVAGAVPFVLLGCLTGWLFAAATYACAAAVAGAWFLATERR